jgi:hypothetical protein
MNNHHPKKILNNLVSEHKAEYIKNCLMFSNIKWLFTENTVSRSFIPKYNLLDNLVDSWQLVNLTFSDNTVHDQQTFEIIRPIIDNFVSKEEIKDLYIHKIKINTLFQNKDYQSFYFNAPHQDSTDEEFSTLIYYVNDSDGDTVFFDSVESNNNSNLDLNVEKRISPNCGSAVVFKSNQYHASSNPIISQRRLVINMIFKAYG